MFSFSGIKTARKTSFERCYKLCLFTTGVLPIKISFNFLLYLFWASRWCFYQNGRYRSTFSNCKKNGEFESNYFRHIYCRAQIESQFGFICYCPMNQCVLCPLSYVLCPMSYVLWLFGTQLHVSWVSLSVPDVSTLSSLMLPECSLQRLLPLQYT